MSLLFSGLIHLISKKTVSKKNAASGIRAGGLQKTPTTKNDTHSSISSPRPPAGKRAAPAPKIAETTPKNPPSLKSKNPDRQTGRAGIIFKGPLIVEKVYAYRINFILIEII
ncbi:MAG: hypothetical protein LBO05_12310 [Deltaproteobacteria bacterium]|nr:hypothetical protein [Deltaproteobacteria bacterium]